MDKTFDANVPFPSVATTHHWIRDHVT